MAFKCKRWTCANLLPVAFVVWVIGMIWGTYTFLHLLPLLQYPHGTMEFQRGVWQACASQALTAMLVTCFLRAIFTDPGSVPETSEWRSKEVQNRLRMGLGEEASPRAEVPGEVVKPRPPLEVKQTGERRFCKWCDRYKPDRCHHCRVCRSCILRMDHHCPWIANCVGFRNHKFFLLLVFYSLCTVLFVLTTMLESLDHVVTHETTACRRFLVVFGVTLACIMGALLLLFFPLHLWLMLKAMTTIEFCEKRYRYQGPSAQVTYNLGTYRNLRAVLGPHILLWLLPISPPEGTGVYFDAGAKPFAAHGGGPDQDSAQTSRTERLPSDASSGRSTSGTELLSNDRNGTDLHITQPRKDSAQTSRTERLPSDASSGRSASGTALLSNDAPEVTGVRAAAA